MFHGSADSFINRLHSNAVSILSFISYPDAKLLTKPQPRRLELNKPVSSAACVGLVIKKDASFQAGLTDENNHKITRRV